MILLRAMALISWIFLRLNPRCANKPSLRQLWKGLAHPEKEPFS
jgi:hypothetical protein